MVDKIDMVRFDADAEWTVTPERLDSQIQTSPRARSHRSHRESSCPTVAQG